MGHHVTVALMPSRKGKPALTEKLADDVLRVDLLDHDALSGAVHRLHGQRPVHAVVPGFEYFVPAAALLSARLGLPGLLVEAADRLRQKHLMRDTLGRAGVRSARHSLVQTGRPDWRSAVEAAVGAVSLPCVVKPVDLGGSVMVRLARTVAEAVAAVGEIANAGPDAFGLIPRPLALIEEFITGPEYSVEGHISPDGPSIVSITRKLLGDEPYFVERGHVVETLHDTALGTSVRAYIEEVIEALGLTTGVFHGEVRMTAEGPVLMEIGARLPGDHICELIQLAHGVDLAAVFVNAMLGKGTAAYTPDAESTRAAGIRFLLRPGLADYTAVTGFDEARALDGYVDSALSYAPGQPIPQAADFSGRLGWFIFTAPDALALEAALDKADQLVGFA
ncbi:ATP-grasp domain-containing protein [Streptomyces platensis]|uniref:ATP-grasp domain-containing protein n=1 Tax=Streptomyces platensis TaxID=58346 RepID=UPI002E259236|nr:ATP-grasp domain-containing protein [Streptomyces platensis]WUB85088.1 ATP-grasp domain-containing protein [Streptomyces platensis]